VPRVATKSTPAAKPTARGSVRQRAGAAIVETSVFESVLDRILVKRLRPLRADVTAARKNFEQQVTQRIEAEARATRLEEEAQDLRVQVQLLQEELAVAQQRRTGWFRRRAVSTRTQEA
jgi:nucleosome binding factor SPN SPT16 subunit